MDFDQYYQGIYKDRWPKLKEALLSDEKQVLRANSFSSKEALQDLNPFIGLKDCYELPAQGESITRDEQGLLQFYIMDPSSIAAAQALQVQSGDQVLDLCAAPGGKTLILAEALEAKGELIANEFSAARRGRLTKVIQQYIPRSVRDRVWVTGQDGSRYGLKKPEFFDRILVDAPCSGERHLLKDAKAFKDWGPARTKHLSQRQYALLASAWLAIKPGGYILYSTCSISPLENDSVVERLLKKKSEAQLIEVEPILKGAEKSRCGWLYLPDQSGFGPLYFSLIQKAQI